MALVLRRRLVNDGLLRRRWSSRVNLKAKGRRSIINKPFKEYGNTMIFHHMYTAYTTEFAHMGSYWFILGTVSEGADAAGIAGQS